MAYIGDLMGHYHVVLCINSGLCVIANYADATPTGSHRTRIGVGQGYLLIRSVEHFFFYGLKLLNFLFELGDAVLEVF